MEIQLRLDEHGRTRAEQQEDKSGEECAEIDYTPKSAMTCCFAPPRGGSHEEAKAWRSWMDDILFDCEITDCGLMPRTFWMPADGTEPRCALEDMALSVFRHHVPSGFSFDPSCSGAEWWVQIRPSPPNMGRYAMYANDDDGNDMSKTGISFHWDKDEDLRILAGGSLYVHPHLSTVTYLTSLGAPTMALNCRVHPYTGDWIVPVGTEESVEAIVSWPKQGKHLSFDGRFLHSAPPDLMHDGAFEEQCKLPVETTAKETFKAERKKLMRRHRRVTFLVNVWLDYKPFNVEPFPETMLDKLTGLEASKRYSLFAESNTDTKANGIPTLSVTVSNGRIDGNFTEASSSCTTRFSWPMGDFDSKETVEADIPLTSIRGEAPRGGNIRIIWKTSAASPAGHAGVLLLRRDERITDAGEQDSQFPNDNKADELSEDIKTESLDTKTTADNEPACKRTKT